MEQSNSLLLNEEGLNQQPEHKKPLFVYEWLRYLNRILPLTQKADIKSCQQKLIEQLTQRISTGPGPPTRILLAKCIAQVFSIADTYDLFQTINICNDALKAKDDSTSQTPIKLTVLQVLGAMYENLGRLVGRSYEESYGLMAKWLKSAESSSRTEILITLSKMIHGLGSAAYSIHRDLYKMISKSYLTDRVMSVRSASATCLLDLVSEEQSPIYANDLDSISTICLRALEGSNYEVRMIIAKVFAKLVKSTLNNKQQSANPSTSVKTTTLEEALNFMATGFLRGGIGGFLKSSTGAASGGHKEIRVGVALAYVEVVQELGASWLEKNLLFFIRHILEVVYKTGPLAYTTNPAQAAEVVYMRRCISYIFRNTLGQLLSEPAQILSCKHIGELLNEYINSFDCSMETEERILNADAYSSAQASIVSLMEISSLVRQIGTSVTPLFVEASGIMEPVFACLLHPIFPARIAAAWCLRCVTYSVPSQATPIVDRCINRLEHMKKSGEAVSGCSLALSGLLAGSQDSQLGIPFCKSRQVFTAAEDMIKTATQTCKLAHKKLQAGWMLITAITSMGSPFMRHNVSRLLMLWKHSFPRSTEEAKGEKSRGDIFTWECTLENRAGALASMDSFIQNCPELVTDEVIKKIILPVETSLTTMSIVAELLYTHGTKLRASIYGFRIRLYSLLSHLNMKYFEHAFSHLLRELVADITLSDNAQATTCSSLVSGLCTSVESCFLGGWLKNTDHAMLEYDPNPILSGTCGSIEYDPMHLISGTVDDNAALWPEPLPTHIASLDAAVLAFGRVYPVIPAKHKLQLTTHFLNIIKKEKQGTLRLYSIQLNILSAVLCAMKATGELRNAKIEGEELQRANIELVVPFLNSDRMLLKSLAIETLGRLAQAVGEPQFVAGNAQLCFDKLRSIRDEKSRTGFALTLGCLHRFVGSLGSGQHLNTSVSIILALAQDNSSPAVQAWAILSLSLIANTGGGMFRGYVEITLSFCLKMLMSMAATNSEIVLCIGKLVSSLITSIGPELQSTIGTIDDTRASLLTASAMMLEYNDPQIKAEAIACYQQLHLFAPRFVQLDRLVTIVCNLLYNEHLILRKAAVACLRQLLQREAREVREHAQNLLPAGIMDKSKESPLPETGLEGALFELLDTETDKELRQHIKECLLFLVQATSSELLGFWLTMCKDILASSMNAESMRSTMMIDDTKTSIIEKSTNDDDEKDDGGDDEDTLQAVPLGDVKAREKVSPRWQTRVFAFEIVQRLMAACETERAHLDLALAKELQMSSQGRADYLVLHLSDLVRMSFMGATSDNSNLRLAGLACLQDVINRFAAVPEPEFPGHVILEQFQAQVGAALRPAFVPETPSHVTAAACQVCSTWIGSGVARDLNDLRRVHQLLVSSLGKLKHGSINTQLYNDSAATLEKLSILKAWAEVYIVAVKQQDERPSKKLTPEEEDSEYGGSQESLLNLVNPELNSLVGHWLDALRDSALLSLPSEFGPQMPEEGGAFYTPDSADSCKEYYRNSWPPILLATSIWLNKNNFEIDSSTASPQKWSNDKRENRFHLMLGMCAEALCSRNNHHDNDKTIQLCLNTLKNLIECEWAQLELMKNVHLPVEIMNILHRLILTRDNLQTQKACADVVVAILSASKTAMKRVGKEDSDNGNPIYQGYQGNEGANGFESKSSLSFATLEICLCLLVRQIPQINSALMKAKPMAPLHFRKYARLPMESYELIQIAVQILVQVPTLCSQEGSIIVLPSILYLILGVLRESSRIDQDQLVPDSPPGHVSVAAAAAMVAIRTLTSSQPTDEKTLEHWGSVMRSFLLSLINLSESEQIKVDKAVIMLATTVLVTSLPANFSIGSALFHKYCRLLKSCVESEHIQVQVKGLQSVNSIFSRKEICAPYIRELGPVVFAKIKPYVVPEAVLKGEKDETQLGVLEEMSEQEVVILQESIKAVEAVLSFSKGEKEMMFVNLLTRCLARFLFTDPVTQLRTAPTNVRKMHEFAFQRLNLIGPQHPEPFKVMLQGCPRIKQRTEAAAQVNIKLQQAQQQAEALKKLPPQKPSQATVQQPKIQLTMNFAAFDKP